jgi:hypothetical protein
MKTNITCDHLHSKDSIERFSKQIEIELAGLTNSNGINKEYINRAASDLDSLVKNVYMAMGKELQNKSNSLIAIKKSDNCDIIEYRDIMDNISELRRDINSIKMSITNS